MSEYPNDEQIEQVKVWKFDRPTAFTEFMEFVKSIGHYWPNSDPFGWKQDGQIYHVSTGGWSGNEEIIGAMRDNFIFWSVCWQQSNRGGHYVFELPDPDIYFRKQVQP